MSIAPPARLFKSFLQGGFECSTHRRRDGRRLDLIAATRHDAFALQDYRALARQGMWTVRDGVRWHLIEAQPNQYEFSSVIPMLRAAQSVGTQVIWDLFHYGWPGHIDIFSAGFVDSFRRFARAFAFLLKNQSAGPAFICPVNEISYVSWAGGDVEYLNPFARDRGPELKTQLVRASIAAMAAMREILPDARFVMCEPAIHIAPGPLCPEDQKVAEDYRLFQFQALDMLQERLQSEGQRLDVIGINFYCDNQWIHEGPTLERGDALYRPLREILREFHARYQRPVFVSETGIEGDRRPEWLAYIADEVMAARESGVPVEGICLYPIVNHPGWDNDRHCHNGLFDYPDQLGQREIFAPLANELQIQRRRFSQAGLPNQRAMDDKFMDKLNGTSNGTSKGSSILKAPSLAVDLICFSHLRWGFVYQRPQHLLTRFAKVTRVFFVEEPILAGGEPRLEVRVDAESGVYIVVPHFAAGMPEDQVDRIQQTLLNQLIKMARIDEYFLWYYTPMAMGFTHELTPLLAIYDCMDELSAFQGAPPALHEREKQLFGMADMVFTGGQTLYEAKREQHPDVHAFPSSVDVAHFAQARQALPDPGDQLEIPHPRIGYCGVIDERMDLDLLARVAELRPDWHLVMVGPVVKIDPAALPSRPNIHYLGSKSYKELPGYLAGWDVAMLPFARNESTRFISPTKTPEYLAAGKPAVSTSIRDVIRPYGDLGLVEIADQPDEFVAAIERALTKEKSGWLKQVDALLQKNSWDFTWQRMFQLIEPRLSRTKAHPATGVRSQSQGLKDHGFQNGNSQKDVLLER